MTNETKLIVGLSLAAGTAAGTYYLKRRFNMLLNENEMIERELSPIEKEKISDSIKGMSEQELRVALQHIPVGLMFDEIGARLVAHEQFAAHIQEALECLPK